MHTLIDILKKIPVITLIAVFIFVATFSQFPKVALASPSNLLSESIGPLGGTSSATTSGSITPTANHTLMAMWVGYNGSTSADPTMSGAGVTWTIVGRVQSFGAAGRMLVMFMSDGTAGSSGQLTLTMSGSDTLDRVRVTVDQMDEVDTVVGSPQYDTGSFGTALSISLTPSNNNHMYGGWGQYGASDGSPYTAGSGLTKLADVSSGDSNVVSLYRRTGGTALSATASASGVYGGIAVELKPTTPSYTGVHGTGGGVGTLSGAVAVGDVIILGFEAYGTADADTFSDDLGNTYTKVFSSGNPVTDGHEGGIYYSVVTVAGTPTITGTDTGGGLGWEAAVFSGLTATPLDQSTFAINKQATASATTLISSGATGTRSQNDEVLWATLSNDDSSTYSADTGWTIIEQNSLSRTQVAYQIVTTTGTDAGKMNVINPHGYDVNVSMSVATFKAVRNTGGGGGSSPTAAKFQINAPVVIRAPIVMR